MHKFYAFQLSTLISLGVTFKGRHGNASRGQGALSHPFSLCIIRNATQQVIWRFFLFVR